MNSSWVSPHAAQCALMKDGIVKIRTAWNPGKTRPGRRANEAANRALYQVSVAMKTRACVSQRIWPTFLPSRGQLGCLRPQWSPDANSWSPPWAGGRLSPRRFYSNSIELQGWPAPYSPNPNAIVHLQTCDTNQEISTSHTLLILRKANKESNSN